MYPTKWDSVNNRWIVEDSSQIPNIRAAIEKLRKSLIHISVDAKKNFVIIKADVYDPVLAKQLIDFYIYELDMRILNDVKKESDINRAYLERQINITPDPIVKERILNFMAFEIEKAGLMSSHSIDILEKPMVSIYPVKPQKKKILIVYFFVGFSFSLSLAYLIKFIGIIKERRLSL